MRICHRDLETWRGSVEYYAERLRRVTPAEESKVREYRDLCQRVVDAVAAFDDKVNADRECDTANMELR